LVTEVEPLGQAAAVGIRVNDLIISVQDTKVKDVRQFWQEIRKQDIEKGIRLVVQTDSSRRFVFIRSGG